MIAVPHTTKQKTEDKKLDGMIVLEDCEQELQTLTVPDWSPGTAEDTYQKFLEYLNNTWEIRNAQYSITSHRMISRRITVPVRRLLNDEVRRYIDPLVFHQTEFNANVVRILNWYAKKIEELEHDIRDLKRSNEKGKSETLED